MSKNLIGTWVPSSRTYVDSLETNFEPPIAGYGDETEAPGTTDANSICTNSIEYFLRFNEWCSMVGIRLLDSPIIIMFFKSLF